jgi:hypothetical protein
MKTFLLPVQILMLLCTLFVASSCEVDPADSDSSLQILKGPNGQSQTITANIDNNGYTNFNAQTVLAEGGSPLHYYSWSLDLSSSPPVNLTIDKYTGVINRIGNSSTGLNVGTTSFKVTVTDGSVIRTENIDLKISNYTPGPGAVLQQLSSAFQLMDGEANKPYGASLFVMGGTPPYKWILDSSYPGSVDLTKAGLTVEGNGGIITGTIMNSAAGSTINFKVKVTDKNNESAAFSPVYTINVK